MPVYAYRCDSCGVQFERHQSYSEAPLRVCPECRKKALKRIISPVRVVFKGSGFYSTDHRASTVSSTPAASKDKKKEEVKPAKPAKESPAEKKD